MLQIVKIFSVSAVTTGLDSKVRQILAAALLGVIVVSGVGFFPMDTVHNAAHDTRHSISFPCH